MRVGRSVDAGRAPRRAQQPARSAAVAAAGRNDRVGERNDRRVPPPRERSGPTPHVVNCRVHTIASRNPLFCAAGGVTHQIQPDRQQNFPEENRYAAQKRLLSRPHGSVFLPVHDVMVAGVCSSGRRRGLPDRPSLSSEAQRRRPPGLHAGARPDNDLRSADRARIKSRPASQASWSGARVVGVFGWLVCWWLGVSLAWSPAMRVPHHSIKSLKGCWSSCSGLIYG